MANILIVEDDPDLGFLLVNHLSDIGHSCNLADSVQVAQRALAENQFDLIVCDVALSEDSGLDLIASVAVDLPETATMMISGIDDFDTARAALDHGALGYLVKPFSLSELEINVFAALSAKTFEKERLDLIAELQRKIGDAAGLITTVLEDLERYKDVTDNAEHEVAKKLGLALGLRDDETGEHIERVSRFSEAMGKRAGYSEEELTSLHRAAALHDIGKIGIPDAVLLKPGRLNPEEYRIIQGHAELGFRLLSDGGSSLLKLGASVAHSHHENWDGSGYPRGLYGDEIPHSVRIVAIADVFDAVTSARVYRPAFSIDEGIDLIQSSSGTKFDPEIVKLFSEAKPELIDIKAQLPDRVDERIRVFLVDYHEAFVEGLIRILGMHADISPVGSASTLAEAKQKVKRTRPQIVLLGFMLPDGEGIDLLPWLLTEIPGCSVIMFSGDIAREMQLRAVEAGCAGFVDEAHAADKIVSAVRTIFAGEPWLPPHLVRSILSQKRTRRAKGRFDLSDRELQVLQMTANGLTSDDIAEKLVLSQHTVRNHIQRSITKLGAHSRLQAVAKAAELGLIKVGSP